MSLPNLVRTAGWFRIVFGALAIFESAARHVLLMGKHTPDAGVALGGRMGLTMLGEMGFLGPNLLAGIILHGIAKEIEARRGYTTCVAMLIFTGVFPCCCDLGWLVSAPISIYAVFQIIKVRSEFE